MTLASTQMTNPALERWIDVATNNLCGVAKARVRAELEAHYEAVYEQLLNSGTSREEAAREACERLGSAKDANRRYKRVYLTASESRSIARLGRVNHRGEVVLWLSAVVFPMLMLVAFLTDSHAIGYDRFLNMGFLFVLAAFTTLLRHFAARPSVQVAVRFAASTLISALFLGLVISWTGPGALALATAVVLVTGIVFEIPSTMRLLVKLRNSPRGTGK